MSAPTIQYFGESDTWTRPDGAVRADVVVCAAGGGGSAAGRGENGEIQVKTFWAPDIPPQMEIEIGHGGRGTPGYGDGRDGYAVIITHCG